MSRSPPSARRLIRIDEKPRATFWAHYFQLPAGGMYMGFQTNGSRFDGSGGDTVIFSGFGASAARGPSCGTWPPPVAVAQQRTLSAFVAVCP